MTNRELSTAHVVISCEHMIEAVDAMPAEGGPSIGGAQLLTDVGIEQSMPAWTPKMPVLIRMYHENDS